ncbi:MAG: F0F1 ATP synthase subunit B [Candidatus Paceibacterota bacterium]|jgi:F-type H+-transporting ATPase subunit b
MESIISTFHIDWKIIIAQAVNFAIVFGVLYFYALKPLGKLMDERSEKIARGITDAKMNAETLMKTKEAHEETLVKARAEAQVIFQTAKKEAEVKKAEMLEKTKAEVAVLIDSGKKTLEAEKNKMVEEARGEIVALAMAATEKLLNTKIDKDFNNKTVKELHNI